MSQAICAFPDCDRPVRAKLLGLCGGHSEQLRRGHPLKPLLNRGLRDLGDFCKNGHPRTPENLRADGSGCKVCVRERVLADARAKGVKPVTPGPDKRGHLPNEWPRRPGRSDCAECHRLDQLERYKSDREAFRTRAREYARQHKTEARARHKAWRDANVGHVRAYSLEQARARHAGRTKEGTEYIEILRRDPCAYCGGRADAIDHIEPLARGGGNTWENLASACGSCNSKKRDKVLLLFLLAQAT